MVAGHCSGAGTVVAHEQRRSSDQTGRGSHPSTPRTSPARSRDPLPGPARPTPRACGERTTCRCPRRYGRRPARTTPAGCRHHVGAGHEGDAKPRRPRRPSAPCVLQAPDRRRPQGRPSWPARTGSSGPARPGSVRRPRERRRGRATRRRRRPTERRLRVPLLGPAGTHRRAPLPTRAATLGRRPIGESSGGARASPFARFEGLGGEGPVRVRPGAALRQVARGRGRGGVLDTALTPGRRGVRWRLRELGAVRAAGRRRHAVVAGVQPRDEGTPRRGGTITYGLEGKTDNFCLPTAQLAMSGSWSPRPRLRHSHRAERRRRVRPSTSPAASSRAPTTALDHRAATTVVRFHDGTPVDAAARGPSTSRSAPGAAPRPGVSRTSPSVATPTRRRSPSR